MVTDNNFDGSAEIFTLRQIGNEHGDEEVRTLTGKVSIIGGTITKVFNSGSDKAFPYESWMYERFGSQEVELPDGVDVPRLIDCSADTGTIRYSKIPGSPLDMRILGVMEPKELDNIFLILGKCLGKLHDLGSDPEFIGPEEKVWIENRGNFPGVFLERAKLLAPQGDLGANNSELAQASIEYIENTQLAPSELVLGHNDLHGSNLLVGKDQFGKQELKGIIDFANVNYIPPAADFRKALRFGARVIRSAIDGYFEERRFPIDINASLAFGILTYMMRYRMVQTDSSISGAMTREIMSLCERRVEQAKQDFVSEISSLSS